LLDSRHPRKPNPAGVLRCAREAQGRIGSSQGPVGSLYLGGREVLVARYRKIEHTVEGAVHEDLRALWADIGAPKKARPVA
jgi:hypothetical protein